MDIGQAQAPQGFDGQAVALLAQQMEGAFRGLLQAGDDLGQLLLAAALHAGHTQDAAGAQIQADAVQHGDAVLVHAGKPPHPEHRLPLFQGRLLNGLHRVAAHHQAGDVAGRQLFHLIGAHHLARPHDGQPVADGLHLVDLVGDKDDGVPALFQKQKLLEQLLRLLGGQHGRGLVQDDQVGVAVKAFEDLHLLFLAHGDVAHQFLGLDVEAVLFRQLVHGVRAGAVEKDASARLHAHHDVFRHGQVLSQVEVLVHHADAQGHRLLGRIDLLGLAVVDDGAPVRLLVAEQHFHQGGFAGAVLAHQGVYLAAAHAEGHVFIGQHAVVVYFCDAVHFQQHATSRGLHCFFRSFLHRDPLLLGPRCQMDFTSPRAFRKARGGVVLPGQP